MSDFSLHGHAALITGSSRGIGAGMARGFARAGSRLVLHGLDEKPDDASLHSHPYCRLDVLGETAVDKLLDAAFTHEPELNLLVCNVGSFFDTSLLEMSREHFGKTMALNVEATFFIAQGFARRLVAAKRPGSIVIISSTNGFQPEYGSTMYDTSKGALVMMTRSLALNLADDGIRVNGLAPGFIRTPLTEGSLKRSPGLQETLEKKIAQARIGTPDDCAGAAVFLSSPAAQYITGQTIIVDGGLTLGQLPRFP